MCWLCEASFTECENDTEGTLRRVRDHDHRTGKYRGAAHSNCKMNVKQKRSNFFPIFFHNFSGYDCHLIFEELLIMLIIKNMR